MCSKSMGMLVGNLGTPECRSRKVAGGVGGVTLIGLVVRVMVALPASVLLDMVNLMLAALAVGWLVRSGIHGRIRYFHPLPAGACRRYRLMLVSILNVCFSIFWFAAAAVLLREENPLATFIAAGVLSGLAFLLGLWTLAAARAAGYSRGSEWVRRRYRSALEPGSNTWLGWVLVKLIDLRSDERQLSTFVSGTLALLLADMVLMAPAM